MSILKSHSERIIFINIRVVVAGKEQSRGKGCAEASPGWLSCQLCVRHVRVNETCLLPEAAAAAGTATAAEYSARWLCFLRWQLLCFFGAALVCFTTLCLPRLLPVLPATHTSTALPGPFHKHTIKNNIFNVVAIN